MTGTTEAASAAATSAVPGGSRHRARGAVAFPVVLVLVIAVTVGVCLALTRDDGAATPEAAVDDLIDAVSSGDAAGVLLALPPAERQALTERADDLTGTLRSLGLVDGGDGDPPGLPSLVIDDPRVSTTPYAEDVAAVDLIGGQLTIAFGPEGDGPLTEAGRDLLEGPESTAPDGSGTITRDLAQQPIRLITIREGGGWHVSVAYSVVDALVAGGGTALPAIGDGPFGYGAATAEAAVVDLFTAYADSDLDRLIALLAVDEARSLYDYAPMILPGTTQLVEDLRAGGAYDVQLNSISTAVEGSGGTRQVRVTGLDLDIRDQVRKLHLVLQDGCLHVDYRIDDDDQPYERYDICGGEWDDPEAATRPLDNAVGNAAVFGGGAELPSFTVIERNGRWFISPISSLFDATVDTLAALDAADQRAFLERLTRSGRAGVGEGLIGNPVPTELSPEERAATLVARCDALLPDEPSTAPVDPGAVGGAAPDTSGATAAPATAETFAGATRRDCIDRLVRTGSIAWDAIPEDRRGGLAPPPPPPA